MHKRTLFRCNWPQKTSLAWDNGTQPDDIYNRHNVHPSGSSIVKVIGDLILAVYTK